MYSRKSPQSSVEAKSRPAARRRRQLLKLRAPRRSTRPWVPGDIDDGEAARPATCRRRRAPRTRRRASPRPGRRRSRPGSPVSVRRADRQRAGALEDLEGDLVVRHPHRDRAAGVAEVPLQRRLGVADQGQRPGPELLDERAGVARDPDRERVERGGRRDQHRRRHLATAALGVEQVGDRLVVEGVRGDPVDGVRRQQHAASPRWIARLAAATAASRSSGGRPVAYRSLTPRVCQSRGREAWTARQVADGRGPRSSGRSPRSTSGTDVTLHVGVLDARPLPRA